MDRGETRQEKREGGRERGKGLSIGMLLSGARFHR